MDNVQAERLVEELDQVTTLLRLLAATQILLIAATDKSVTRSELLKLVDTAYEDLRGWD